MLMVISTAAKLSTVLASPLQLTMNFYLFSEACPIEIRVTLTSYFKRIRVFLISVKIILHRLHSQKKIQRKILMIYLRAVVKSY